MIVAVSYDTVSKKLTITKDGKDVPNCQSVSFYNYGDMSEDSEYSMDISQCINSAKDDGTVTRISTMAKLFEEQFNRNKR